MDPKELDPQFFSLVSTLAAACWQHLGKAPSQLGGPLEKDLEGAMATIKTMLMLRDKTQGNLTSTEERLLEDTISSLQENYEKTAAEEDEQ